jgi:large subunit ribosomal protein L6
MSRIGRLPVTIPSGVKVDIDGQLVTVQGPKGTLRHTVAEPIDVVREDDVLKVTRPNDEGNVRALHGLSRTLIANMVTGVTDGYRKTLEIVGVGYRVQAKGSNLEFALGFSHPVPVVPPEGITFRVETPTRFVVEGIDKQRWARWPRKSASSASPTPIRARACGTRVR